MKKLQEDAKERIANNFSQHTMYKSIKKTEMDWFDMSINYRLSAEQVFYEVMTVIDKLKQKECYVDWDSLYKCFMIDYRQSAPIAIEPTEINNIVTIIMISLFSPLALSNNLALQSTAKKLADQCAKNNKGYYKNFQKSLCTFDQLASEIEKWIDNYIQIDNNEYISKQIELLIFPNHYSKYQKRGLGLGKSDDEVHANFAKAARMGPTALVKYLVSSEGKIYFDFLGDGKPKIVETINQELGTSLTLTGFRQAVNRSSEKPKL